jgi:hypothetical protein
VRISATAVKAELHQTQLWLRGHGHALHVQHVTPRDAEALHGVIDQGLKTVRFER